MRRKKLNVARDRARPGMDSTRLFRGLGAVGSRVSPKRERFVRKNSDSDRFCFVTNVLFRKFDNREIREFRESRTPNAVRRHRFRKECLSRIVLPMYPRGLPLPPRPRFGRYKTDRREQFQFYRLSALNVQ